jgi:hypothetical protein
MYQPCGWTEKLFDDKLDRQSGNSNDSVKSKISRYRNRSQRHTDAMLLSNSSPVRVTKSHHWSSQTDGRPTIKYVFPRDALRRTTAKPNLTAIDRTQLRRRGYPDTMATVANSTMTNRFKGEARMPHQPVQMAAIHRQAEQNIMTRLADGYI